MSAHYIACTVDALIFDIVNQRHKGQHCISSGLLLKQGLDWDWTGDGLEMDWRWTGAFLNRNTFEHLKVTDIIGSPCSLVHT